jgi:ribosomal protein L34E
MSDSLECPRCHLQAENRPRAGPTPQRCSACGAPLVLAPHPREVEVRRYLYHHRLLPLTRPLGGRRVSAR